MDKWEALSNLLADLVVEKSIHNRTRIAARLMYEIPGVLKVKLPRELQEQEKRDFNKILENVKKLLQQQRKESKKSKIGYMGTSGTEMSDHDY